jgi:small-conductance mechanosensitive channel
MMWSGASAIPGKCASNGGGGAGGGGGGTRLMLAGGQILPVLRKLAPSNHDVHAIWTLLRGTVHPVDLLVLTMLGWGTVPMFGVIYYYCFRRRPRKFSLKRMGLSTASSFSKEEEQRQQVAAEEDSDEDDDGVLLSSIFTSDDFLSSYMFHVADHVSQASRLAILVYLVDCLAVLLAGLGFSSPALHHPNTNLSTCFAKILYIAWAAQRMSVFKRYLLGRVIHKQQRLRMMQQQQQNGMGTNGSTHTTTHGGTTANGNGSNNGLKRPEIGALRRSSTTGGDVKTLGQAAIIDRLVDGLIWVVTGLFLLDILNVEMGVGVSSIFAFGSAGTLVMGLASKDVASMFVSGLTLTTTNHVREGDHVKFGDGTSGQILRIGWMHTTIRGYDELVEVVRHVNNACGMECSVLGADSAIQVHAPTSDDAFFISLPAD